MHPLTRLTAPLLTGAVAVTERVVGAGGGAGTDGVPARPADDDRFDALPDWPWQPNYVRVEPGGYRMAYVDAGPADGPVVWLQHGNPAWGYYYRHAIGPLVAAGFRVVVPDLIGFGRSDKPASRAVHTYANHEAWLRSMVEQLDLRDVRAHLHDWGGLLGLRIVAFSPERFNRVLASNTGLPFPSGRTVPPLFRIWQVAAQGLPSFGQVIGWQASRPLPPGVKAAYDAPFPDRASSLGPRQLPLRVPLVDGDEAGARNRSALSALGSFEKPFLTAYSVPDDITTGAAELFQATVPGAAGLEHAEYPGTKHYLMEDVPEELTALMLRFFAD